MTKLYRSAQGRPVDMDKLRLINEETIAVGNMKVNARGDELGPGGQITRSRNEIMRDYYNLNTPVAEFEDTAPNETKLMADIEAQRQAQPASFRGSLADSIVRNRSQRHLDDPDGVE